MLRGIIGKVVGDPSARAVQKLQPVVAAINELEPAMERRTDAELGTLTGEFRAKLAAGETLDDFLAEAFAVVREVAKRTVDMRPFDVQLIGGIVLHQGKVAEMRTGEGKTLVATMPVYLNALLGRGVHLITVNDYLARRDSLWMGPIYDLMGLSIGLLQSGPEQPSYLYDPDYQRDPYPGLRPVARREAYAADITYGTNNEFGFDYLRDNLALTLEQRVQRPLYYAIVDEVDNIFIDEARTPLIISGPSGEPVEEYSRFAAIARRLEPEIHYELDEKERAVFLTEDGLSVVEQETGIENIYDEANYRYVHYMQQALKAQVLYVDGRDYIRQRKQVILIDQHTGRLMPSRRLSEGLHQAIEAKEGVPIRPRDVTSATVTIQNYFRMYEKLAGMSGTAITEAEEFFKIYNLDVLAIPTNKPVIRADHVDVVYRGEEAKYRAVAREILDCTSRGQPVLVGTTSVQMSEHLAKRLSGESLQMAALAPRAAYALQDADIDSEKRNQLRETLSGSLETINSAAWRRTMRDIGLEPNALSEDNLGWIADYLELPDDPEVRRAVARAFREGIDHKILNAKEHTREAAIIARAGQPGAVTIATNMAGRGVDIKLGGQLSDEDVRKAHQALRSRGIDPFAATPAQMDSAVAEVVPQYAKRREQALVAGGLHVLGTERHEARRIDNQLRGRAGRQGEPGSSRFFLSLEDDLMRRFGRREMLGKLMEQIGDDFPIEHNLVSRTIERAQTSVEGHNFDIRKHLLEYDDVLNRQRETIYAERLRIIQSDDLQAEVSRILEGQVDEYLEKYGDDPDQQRLLFVGLDDIVPLILPSPKSPFQGPLAFGGHLTAFAPFTISFVADQLANEPLEEVRATLSELSDQAAAKYGEQVRHTVSEIAQGIEDKYEERLDRYRALLDEKIEDYLQLAQERGQAPDARRLAQHLERTFPLKLAMPASNELADMEGLDDLHDHWQDQIEIEFHRQECTRLIERAQFRLPAGVQLERVRPAQVSPQKLVDELGRVQQLAVKQARSDAARTELERAFPAGEPSPAQVLEAVASVKTFSDLDFGRLDRLVAHVLGAYLNAVLVQYADAAGEDQVRLQRDLKRLQDSVTEGKKSGRNNLQGVLQQLNMLVHVEISSLEELLGLAVGHEFDKWAQRQLSEIEGNASREPLVSTDRDSIAQYLMATHYTQQQAYDRSHRRRATWMPRLPSGFLAQAYAEGAGLLGQGTQSLRETILISLRGATGQREHTWGQQEMQRWGQYSLYTLSKQAYGDLVHYLGEQQLGALRDRPVEALPPDLYNHLRFILALRQLEQQQLRLGDLPQADELMDRLGEALEDHVLHTPVGKLDGTWQERILAGLRQSGMLDDPAARARLETEPIGDWEERTKDEVAVLWGKLLVDSYKEQPIRELDTQVRGIVVDYLHRQRHFVDEEQIQRFLVHQRLSDLPPETGHAALVHLARAQLDRMGRRKVANLDARTRQSVTASLQRMGLFTDVARRDQLLGGSLSDLEPDIIQGLGSHLARQQLQERGIRDLDDNARHHVLKRLKRDDALADPEQLEQVNANRLLDLNEDVAGQVRDELLDQMQGDLAAKTMEELPAETRKRIHRVLDEHNYFVDLEKVSWYERKTLSHLSSDLLRGLELHLGQHRLTELGSTPFRDLPAKTQESLETFFDSAGVLPERARRLRLIQTGILDNLPDENRDAVAQHLGRQWLVQIRDQRPPNLPDLERETVWTYLREQGYFADEFKEELFTYQRLDEFDQEVRQAVDDSISERLTAELYEQPLGLLSPDMQAKARQRLRQADTFVDPALLQLVETTSVSALPPDLQHAIEDALGEHLLAGLETKPIDELPADVREVLRSYLDSTDYFVDESKKAQLVDRRLADLGTDVQEALSADLAVDFEQEIWNTPVSELDENVRQGVRAAVEAQGYFESAAIREQMLDRPLGSLRREDLDAITVEFGRLRLDEQRDRSLADLPQVDRETLLMHLQARDWFLDPGQVQQLQGQRLVDLESGIHRELVVGLCQQRVQQLRNQTLTRLVREQRELVVRILQEQGFGLDDGEMRQVRRQTVSDLEPDVYHALLQDLGSSVVSGWGTTRFQELGQEEQGLMADYLGRRIMARIERRVLLHTISRLWIDYLTDIEDLRRGIGLEAFGQRDPLVEYKRRAFELFAELGDNIRRITARSLFRQVPASLEIQ